MTRTRSQWSIHDSLIFVDVSGSTSEHTTPQHLSESVRYMCDAAGCVNVSVYTSNHNLTQHYFCNPGVTIPTIKMKFGGLSALYDNVVKCMTHRFEYNPDCPCYVLIISDLEDNMSVSNTKKQFNYHMETMSNMWAIDIVHPKNL